MLKVAEDYRPRGRNPGREGDLRTVRDAASKIVTQHRLGKLSSEEAAEQLRRLSTSRKSFIDWLLDL